MEAHLALPQNNIIFTVSENGFSLIEQKQQRTAVEPGNEHFISIRQVSSDAATLRRGTRRHTAQRPRFYAAAAAAATADAAVYRQ